MNLLKSMFMEYTTVENKQPYLNVKVLPLPLLDTTTNLDQLQTKKV